MNDEELGSDTVDEVGDETSMGCLNKRLLPFSWQPLSSSGQVTGNTSLIDLVNTLYTDEATELWTGL